MLCTLAAVRRLVVLESFQEVRHLGLDPLLPASAEDENPTVASLPTWCNSPITVRLDRPFIVALNWYRGMRG